MMEHLTPYILAFLGIVQTIMLLFLSKIGKIGDRVQKLEVSFLERLHEIELKIEKRIKS